MPLPTTRRARYEYRQKKYARRRRRANENKQGYRWVPGTGYVRTAPQNWTLVGDGGLQLAADLRPPRAGRSGLGGLIPGGHYHVSAADHAVPPHVAKHKPDHSPYDYKPYHWQVSQCGYHVRRVKYAGHKRFPKPARTSYDGNIWAAGKYFEENGVYPLWDALQRLPQG